MLYDINNEFYKNLEYLEFDIKSHLESANNKRKNQEKKLSNIEDKRKEKVLISSNEEKSTNIQSYFFDLQDLQLFGTISHLVRILLDAAILPIPSPSRLYF